MSTFLALYRGTTIADARLVAVSTDPLIVTSFASRLLHEPPERDDERDDDPVLGCIERGRRRALRLLAREASSEPAPTPQVRS